MCFVSILFSVVFGIFLLFKLPYDYIKYKTSLYYKRDRRKYEMFAGSSINFKICNVVIKNKLPVDFIADAKDDFLENMCFVSGDILIISSPFFFAYDDKIGVWDCCKVEDRDTSRFLLEDFIEMEIERANCNAGKKICTKAVIMAKDKNVDNENVARRDMRFLIYNNNLEEVLKDFCERCML